jgi:glycosyltransferase involved in cell wall biosynthesis
MICTSHESLVRIVYILTTLGIGGAERQVISLAERMAARGHTVSIVSLKHADEECPVKLPVLRLNLRKTPLGILHGLRFARNFLTLFRPQIIHSHTFPANIFARLLRLPDNPRGAAPAVINTIHNVYEGGWHRRLIYRLTTRSVTAITAVSSAAATAYASASGTALSQIQVITNGIDLYAFTPDRNRRKRMRTQMQARRNFIWLAIGRIVPAKNYPNLLSAWAIVQQTHPVSRLWIAGEGHPSDIGLSLEPEADTTIEWLGLRRDIPDLLDAADGYVLSSAWEGMPLAVVEAMGMQKPVVVTDVGGVRELIGDNGFIVPAHDSQAFAAAMLRVMALDEETRLAQGKSTRIRVGQHFSIEARLTDWEELYKRVGRTETAESTKTP